MSRFLLSLVLVPLLSACTESPLHTDATSIPIIDAHTHAHFSDKPDPLSGIPETKEEYFKELKEAGVVAAVNLSPQDNWDDPDMQAEGIIKCAGLSAHVNAKALEAALKSGKVSCIKIYLGYVYQYAYDKNYEPAYRLAEKYSVPVVFHTGDTDTSRGKLKFADPLTIDEVAVDHPKVNFVIAHCGNPWVQSAAEVAYKNPNVYLDGSAFLIGDLDKKDPEAIQKLMIEPISFVFTYVEDPSKLMFGTDWPLVNIKAYLEAFKKAIPRKYWQAVLHDNAAHVFKIKR